jgi:hypothetical protein
MKRLFFLFCLAFFAVNFVRAQGVELPRDGQKILEKRFRGWKYAEIDSAIVEYFRRDRSFEQPNLITGDFDGDGKRDYAVLMQKKTDAARRVTIVLMRHKGCYKTHVLDANDCLMSVKKGKKDYDFEAQRSFRYQRDAIFSYIWEKAGVSYVWEKGKFRAIVTSD